MLGYVNISLESFVLDVFGNEVWVKAKEEANLQAQSWLSGCAYADDQTYALVAKVAQITGMRTNEVLEEWGRFFFMYLQRIGYSSLVSSLGSNIAEFMSRTNELHVHLKAPPSFQVEQVTATWLTMRYESSRTGFWPFAAGIMKQVAQELFCHDLHVELVQAKADANDADILRLHFPYQDGLAGWAEAHGLGFSRASIAGARSLRRISAHQQQLQRDSYGAAAPSSHRPGSVSRLSGSFDRDSQASQVGHAGPSADPLLHLKDGFGGAPPSPLRRPHMSSDGVPPSGSGAQLQRGARTFARASPLGSGRPSPDGHAAASAVVGRGASHADRRHSTGEAALAPGGQPAFREVPPGTCPFAAAFSLHQGSNAQQHQHNHQQQDTQQHRREGVDVVPHTPDETDAAALAPSGNGTLPPSLLTTQPTTEKTPLAAQQGDGVAAAGPKKQRTVRMLVPDDSLGQGKAGTKEGTGPLQATHRSDSQPAAGEKQLPPSSVQLPPGFTVPPDMLCSVFPYHFVLDERMVVVQAGNCLQQLLPHLQVGVTPLHDCFKVLHPPSIARKGVDISLDQLQREWHTSFVVELLDPSAAHHQHGDQGDGDAEAASDGRNLTAGLQLKGQVVVTALPYNEQARQAQAQAQQLLQQPKSEDLDQGRGQPTAANDSSLQGTEAAVQQCSKVATGSPTASGGSLASPTATHARDCASGGERLSVDSLLASSSPAGRSGGTHATARATDGEFLSESLHACNVESLLDTRLDRSKLVSDSACSPVLRILSQSETSAASMASPSNSIDLDANPQLLQRSSSCGTPSALASEAPAAQSAQAATAAGVAPGNNDAAVGPAQAVAGTAALAAANKPTPSTQATPPAPPSSLAASASFPTQATSPAPPSTPSASHLSQATPPITAQATPPLTAQAAPPAQAQAPRRVALFLGSPKISCIAELQRHGLSLSDLPLSDRSFDLALCGERSQAETRLMGGYEALSIQLEAERARSEALLHRCLPRHVAQRLREGRPVLATAHPHLTILFSDIVNFTGISSKLQPMEVVDMLNDLYGRFDAIIDENPEVWKASVIGDAYMLVGNLNDNSPDHVDQMIDLAMRMHQAAAQVDSGLGEPIKLRIGIHTGPAVTGTVGGTHSSNAMISFSVWGDTVNTAARMESHGVPGEVHISAAAYACISDKAKYAITERGRVLVKGKGKMHTYLISKVQEQWLVQHERSVRAGREHRKGEAARRLRDAQASLSASAIAHPVRLLQSSGRLPSVGNTAAARRGAVLAPGVGAYSGDSAAAAPTQPLRLHPRFGSGSHLAGLGLGMGAGAGPTDRYQDAWTTGPSLAAAGAAAGPATAAMPPAAGAGPVFAAASPGRSSGTAASGARRASAFTPGERGGAFGAPHLFRADEGSLGPAMAATALGTGFGRGAGPSSAPAPSLPPAHDHLLHGVHRQPLDAQRGVLHGPHGSPLDAPQGMLHGLHGPGFAHAAGPGGAASPSLAPGHDDLLHGVQGPLHRASLGGAVGGKPRRLSLLMVAAEFQSHLGQQPTGYFSRPSLGAEGGAGGYPSHPPFRAEGVGYPRNPACRAEGDGVPSHPALGAEGGSSGAGGGQPPWGVGVAHGQVVVLGVEGMAGPGRAVAGDERQLDGTCDAQQPSGGNVLTSNVQLLETAEDHESFCMHTGTYYAGGGAGGGGGAVGGFLGGGGMGGAVVGQLGGGGGGGPAAPLGGILQSGDGDDEQLPRSLNGESRSGQHCLDGPGSPASVPRQSGQPGHSRQHGQYEPSAALQLAGVEAGHGLIGPAGPCTASPAGRHGPGNARRSSGYQSSEHQSTGHHSSGHYSVSHQSAGRQSTGQQQPAASDHERYSVAQQMIGRLSAARHSAASSTGNGGGAGHGARGGHPGSPCSHFLTAAAAAAALPAAPGLPSPGGRQREGQQPGLQQGAQDHSPHSHPHPHPQTRPGRRSCSEQPPEVSAGSGLDASRNWLSSSFSPTFARFRRDRSFELTTPKGSVASQLGSMLRFSCLRPRTREFDSD